tara:strand:- start:652 stop:1311 length:660 start_codon:yes stop_codon:yes gene_type:complete
MTMEIIPPDVDIDTQALINQNSLLSRLQNDSGSVGPVMQAVNIFTDSENDYLLNIQAYRQMPALTLYINPTDWGTSDTQKFNTYHPYKTEFGGRDQVKISASGKIGAAYTDQTGLTRHFRRNSAGYQQLMHLFMLYQNNGYLYETSNPNQIGMVGSVRITYDSEMWEGHFDTFSMSESADNPYTMEYSFDFTVKYHENNTQLSTSTGFSAGTNSSGSVF